MFTSVDSKILYKRALVYLGISLFLVLFNYIYGIFAHGIGSTYMKFAFAIPLFGGALISLLLLFLPKANLLVCNLWRMGLSSLVVGSLLHGVFDIYGSEVALVNVFFIMGGFMLLGAIIIYLLKDVQTKH